MERKEFRMAKVINVGNSQTEVRLSHAKRNIVYFAENILRIKLLPHIKSLMSELEKDEAGKNKGR